MTYHFYMAKGRGGFARVDIVQDDTGYYYAQKTYDPMQQLIDAVGDQHLRTRFIREVRYQSSIDHINVVKILAHDLDSIPPSFIMPVADCTLKDELEVDPTLGQNLHAALFGILAGLEHLHNCGYVHRDLKPANVLRFTDNGVVRYAISDFGLMSAINSESSTLTGTNANGGTENYAAPELIGNFRRATASADIYAFGAILHDIFGNSAQRIPYTELTLPGAIGRIIEKCTKRLPIRRYPNVSVLREELYQVLNTQPVTFNSSGEEHVVELLRAGNPLSDDEWDRVFLQVEKNLDRGITAGNIFRALSLEHINALGATAPELFNAMGSYFSDYINSNSFDFDYCDVLASKAERFYEGGDLQLKAVIALSMLEMGTSHNRWYVERKAAAMLGTGIPAALAERIAVEVQVMRFGFAANIAHLCRSIGLDRNLIHPRLLQLA